eukprot:TRINITY_DN23604_c0_g1_i1.p1 TRINITY_DN23604_c0_g1~~TRINITY_DN23604_c0_g1_i1.p1  ORF type:complete len:146 (-),score=30.03 TRINITY_DN23604_c0_g1_i1:6-443(-)
MEKKIWMCQYSVVFGTGHSGSGRGLELTGKYETNQNTLYLIDQNVCYYSMEDCKLTWKRSSKELGHKMKKDLEISLVEDSINGGVKLQTRGLLLHELYNVTQTEFKIHGKVYTPQNKSFQNFAKYTSQLGYSKTKKSNSNTYTYM